MEYFDCYYPDYTCSDEYSSQDYYTNFKSNILGTEQGESMYIEQQAYYSNYEPCVEVRELDKYGTPPEQGGERGGEEHYIPYPDWQEGPDFERGSEEEECVGGEEEEVDQLGEGEGEFRGERADLDWGVGAGAEEEEDMQQSQYGMQEQGDSEAVTPYREATPPFEYPYPTDICPMSSFPSPLWNHVSLSLSSPGPALATFPNLQSLCSLALWLEWAFWVLAGG